MLSKYVYGYEVLTMNRKQKIVLWIGIFTIVLMCLFPPWIRVVAFEGNYITLASYGHQFLLSPPESMLICHTSELTQFGVRVSHRVTVGEEERVLPSMSFVKIDLRCLCIQCAIVAAITIGLLCTFTTKSKRKPQEQKSGD